MAEGIVYILTNEAMPGYVKIGKTMTSVTQRIRELDNTSLPYPFECFYAARVANMDRVERLVHDAFADNRVSRRREFFTIDPERVKSAIQLAELEDVTPAEVEGVVDAEAPAALETARTRRRRLPLSALGILPGTVLAFAGDPEVTCTVVDDRKVMFEGEVTSLSRSALTVLHRKGYEWSTVNGWGHWQHQGRTLSELWNEAQSDDWETGQEVVATEPAATNPFVPAR